MPPAALATLRALLDRLIPADDFPGALAAGTDRYILAQLRGDCSAEAAPLALGLAQLDLEAAARHGPVATFAPLAAEDRDALLVALEAGCPATPWPPEISAVAFFNRLVELAHEGFYADPANGGNRDAASWRMLGYTPRPPLLPPDRARPPSL